MTDSPTIFGLDISLLLLTMFLCEYCGKKFTRKSNLKKHSNNKHGGELLEYNCIICKTCCPDRHAYNSHISKHLNSETFQLFRSAFEGTTKIFRKTLKDTRSFLQLTFIKNDILNLLVAELLNYPKYKLNILITVDYALIKETETMVEEFVLKSSNYIITQNSKTDLLKKSELMFSRSCTEGR